MIRTSYYLHYFPSKKWIDKRFPTNKIPIVPVLVITGHTCSRLSQNLDVACSPIYPTIRLEGIGFMMPWAVEAQALKNVLCVLFSCEGSERPLGNVHDLPSGEFASWKTMEIHYS